MDSKKRTVSSRGLGRANCLKGNKKTMNSMKNSIRIGILACLLASVQFAHGQDYQIKTLFNGSVQSGGYGAVTNKFTTMNGKFSNIVELYGGWYVNHKLLVGLEAASLTSNLPVPAEYSVAPAYSMSYQYGQFGLMLEYALWSDKAIHVVFQAMAGPGFTVQYRRFSWDEDYWDSFNDYPHDSNWFFVTEPGVQLEMNLLRWMRLSPGVSYRAVYKSQAAGLSDSDLSGTSFNVTLKFGKF